MYSNFAQPFADFQDCVSFKPNSTDIIVQGLQCTGSHGISVGSLGQYQGETDIIQNIYVYNISMTNAGDMARIKIWPGVAPGVTGRYDFIQTPISYLRVTKISKLRRR
jgi:hypothetical protein